MYEFVLLSIFASACAAPPPIPPFIGNNPLDNFHRRHPMANSAFDAPRFWSELSTEMKIFDQLLDSFKKHFSRSSSSTGYVQNQYQITIALADFEERDIAVKAREGLVMVQATKKIAEGNVRSYMDARSLPSNVNVTGIWTFEHGVLKIIFPLKQSSTTVTSVSTEGSIEGTTGAPKDREELESQENDNTNQDADVGVETGDHEVSSNHVSNHDPVSALEATTYAVDLTNEIEFVPVRY